MSDPIGEQIARYGALDEDESWEGFKRGYLLRVSKLALMICTLAIAGWKPNRELPASTPQWWSRNASWKICIIRF